MHTGLSLHIRHGKRHKGSLACSSGLQGQQGCDCLPVQNGGHWKEGCQRQPWPHFPGRLPEPLRSSAVHGTPSLTIASTPSKKQTIQTKSPWRWLQRFMEACLASCSASFPPQSPHSIQPINLTCPQQLQTTRDILVGKSF